MSAIVFDTNVVSELMKGPKCEPKVREWLRSVGANQRYTTAITIAEVLLGIALLPEGTRKFTLAVTAQEVFSQFEEHVLAFDSSAAGQFAGVVAERTAVGSPIATLDAQIAAVCRAHGFALATRNVRDFSGIDVPLINPWTTNTP